MKVCVVGLGPGGSVIASTLSKQGHQVTIYERDIDPFELDKQAFKARAYPMNIFTHGIQAIQKANLAECFQNEKYCNKIHGALLMGQKVVEERVYGNMGSRNAIMKSFLEALRNQTPQVQIHFQTPVISIDASTGKVTVNNTEKTYDLIIGADGAGSIVRSSIQKESEILGIYQSTIYLKAKSLWLDKNVKPEQVKFIKVLNYLPFFVAIHPPQFQHKAMMSIVYGEQKFRTIQEARNFIHKLSPLAASCASDEELQKFIKKEAIDLGRSITAKQYYYGDKVALVGDAVHKYPPFGHGTALAVKGALNLSEKIKLYCQDIPVALEKYSTSHKREINGAGILQTTHVLFYILLTTYIYALGGAPAVRVRLTYLGEFNFEDIFYFYETSYNYAKKMGVAVILGLVFSLLVGGLGMIGRFVLIVVACFLCLNIQTLMKEDLSVFLSERKIIRGMTGVSSVLTLVLLLIVSLLT